MLQVGNHKSKDTGQTLSGGKETRDSQYSRRFILPFHSSNQSRLLLHVIKKSSRQSLYRKRSNYFQQISPKIRRIAAVTEEAVCDRHIITHDSFK